MGCLEPGEPVLSDPGFCRFRGFAVRLDDLAASEDVGASDFTHGRPGRGDAVLVLAPGRSVRVVVRSAVAVGGLPTEVVARVGTRFRRRGCGLVRTDRFARPGGDGVGSRHDPSVALGHVAVIQFIPAGC